MIRRVCIAVFAVLFVYLGAAFVGAFVPNGGLKASERNVELRLIQGPIHTDFMLPITDETRSVFQMLDHAGMPLNDPRAAWIVVGWGAETFYTTVGTSSDLTGTAIVRGVFGDASVVRFDIWPDVNANAAMTSLWLSPEQARAVYHAIRTDIKQTSPIADVSFNGTDRFFAAKGRFNIFQTCNVWVADILDQAKVAFGAWTPIPWSVTFAKWWHQ
ncbi:MAG: TIGR02117 family protein [Pseudomonadota bacterium]